MKKQILQFKQAKAEEALPAEPEQIQAASNNETSGAEEEKEATQKPATAKPGKTGFESAASTGASKKK